MHQEALPCAYQTDTFRLKAFSRFLLGPELIVGEQLVEDCSLAVGFLALLDFILNLIYFVVHHLFLV